MKAVGFIYNDYMIKKKTDLLIAGQGAAGYSAALYSACLLYTSPSPRDKRQSRMPSSA